MRKIKQKRAIIDTKNGENLKTQENLQYEMQKN